MTMTGTNSPHPVARRLRQAGITSVVIIDDAYNAPVLSDLAAEIEEFRAAIIREEDALAELNVLRAGLDSEDDINLDSDDNIDEGDIDKDLIDVLWAQTLKEELSPLLFHCRTRLFPRYIEKLSELDPLVSYLTEIGITPIRLGTGDDLPDEQLKLFFLDFILESTPALPGSGSVEAAIQQFAEGSEQAPSIQESIDKAKQILSKYDDAFIVLMSSREGVPQARDRFRKETGLIEGMFDYASKEELASERDLNLRLGISAVGLSVRHDIQNFVKAFETSVTEASETFIDRIKSLSIEDYTYIYSFSLRDEGQPLGDYMSWLYKSLLAHLVHNSDPVLEAQIKLDDIDIEAYVPLKRAPSFHLADMYSLSLTEPGTSSDAARLRLGDLFTNEAKEVLLVINADCDLVHSPQRSNRRIPDDRSILLHPGSLKPVDEKVGDDFKVTNLFFHEGEPFKIVWNYDGVITKRYCEVNEWLSCNGYSKRARLIAPHALEIQHKFVANLTRVGLPVPPPLPRPATVQVFGKNKDKTLEKLGEDIPQGMLIDGQGFRLTREGFRELLERVGDGVRHYIEQRQLFDENDNRLEKLEANIEKLESFLQNYEEWFAILKKSDGMPNENGKQIGSQGIFRVFCTPNLEEAESLIAINLLPND